MVLPHVALDSLLHCLSMFYGSSSCCIGLIVILLICVLVPLPHVVFDWLWYCLSVFSWFFLMLHWIDCGIVNLCSHWSSTCSIVLIVTVFICVLFFLPFFALDWLWHCLSVFLWFFLMLHWFDSDIVCLCSFGSSSSCIKLIVTLLICVLVAHPHVVFDLLWYCLSVFSWFYLMLHWIDCGIVYLCSRWPSSCSIVLIVTVFICVLLFLPFLHWIDCDIVYLCSYGSSSCCLGLIVILLFCVFKGLPHVALDWFWYRFPVFSWFFVMMLLIYCDIVYLCSHGSSLCCIELIVTLFICVLLGLPYVALDWLWHCLSVFLSVFLMLHWIDCDIVYLCSHGSSSCRIGLIGHCLSVFTLFLLVLHWIDYESIYLCSYGSSLCCIGLIVTLFNGSSSYWIGLIVTLFISVLMVPPHVALDWLWHCLSVFLWVFLMLHWIDGDIVYLYSNGSFSCCLGFIVTLFVFVLMVLPHVALDWLWHCLSVLSLVFIM